MLYEVITVSASLAEDTEIAFNAGTHTDLVLMSYADFSSYNFV